MSSIFALLSHSASLPAGRLAGQMAGAQARYGVDREFLWSDAKVALGGNLSLLLPEDHVDRQPLWAPDRSCCLAADLRLDNRAELARDLNLPHPEELADSEILLEAWLRWGEASLDHLLGAFAFAVWTPSRQELFAARDHCGERPLFYHRGRDFVALASMPNGLLALPGVSATPDEARVVDWISLNSYRLGSSFFAQIDRLPPAHFLRICPGSVECLPYWNPCAAPAIRFQRDSDYAEALAEILDRATLPRLRSVGGVGAQLSAGIDSSAIVVSAAPLLAAAGHRLTAFTSIPQPGFLAEYAPGCLFDEGPGASDVARMYPNIDHLLIHSAGREFLPDLEAWADAACEPPTNAVNFLWTSAILAEARSRGIRVMLQGVYGNFTVSQEGRDNLQRFFRRGRWIKLLRLARNLHLRGEVPLKGSFFHATNGLLPMNLKRRLRPGIERLRLDHSSLHPGLQAKYGLVQRTIDAAHADFPDLATQRKIAFDRVDLGPTNAAVIARYGIESRDPLGDKRVFEFCFGIPPEQYVAGAQSRSIIRRAMRGRLPEETLRRVVRGDQGADWPLIIERSLPSFRAELELQERSPIAAHFVDLPRLKALLEDWPQSGFDTRQATQSWNEALTRGLALGYFLRTHE